MNDTIMNNVCSQELIEYLKLEAVNLENHLNALVDLGFKIELVFKERRIHDSFYRVLITNNINPSRVQSVLFSSPNEKVNGELDSNFKIIFRDNLVKSLNEVVYAALIVYLTRYDMDQKNKERVFEDGTAFFFGC